MLDVIHEHVPAHRISLDAEMEVLRNLVSHCAGWNGVFILRSRLNDRRGGPSQYPSFTCYVTYPQEGVLRRYVSSGAITSWVDTVIGHNVRKNVETQGAKK